MVTGFQTCALPISLTAAAAFVGLSGITAWHFWADLALLGLGWNFGYIGASAMVVATHRQSERNKVQAFNDFLVFGLTALGSLASGQILLRFGWGMVNLVTFPPIAVSLGALAFVAWIGRAAPRRGVPDA